MTLTIKRHIACWAVNFIACLLYAYLFFEYQLYGETVLQTLFMGMAVYGFFQWKTAQQQKQHIVIQSLPLSKMWLQIALSSLLGLLFGLSLKWWTQASLLLLDAQLTAMSLLATYWTSRKYLATWGVMDCGRSGVYRHVYLQRVAVNGCVICRFCGAGLFGLARMA